MPDRMDPKTRKAVTSAGGVGRAAALTAEQRAEVARAGAAAVNSPAGLASRLVKAWPKLSEEAQVEILAILTAGLPLRRARR